MLPEHARAQSAALHLRRRPRPGARHRQDRGLRPLAPPAQEGGDAVRSPQAHPAPRSIAPARPHSSSRRVPPRRHRSEPAQARKASPLSGAERRHLGNIGPIAEPRAMPPSPFIARSPKSSSTESSQEQPSVAESGTYRKYHQRSLLPG